MAYRVLHLLSELLEFCKGKNACQCDTQFVYDSVGYTRAIQKSFTCHFPEPFFKKYMDKHASELFNVAISCHTYHTRC